MPSFFALFEAFLIALSVSADGFFTAFAYGINKVKIPFFSVLIIDAVSGCITAAALLTGRLVTLLIPGALTNLFCALVLLILGIAKTAFCKIPDDKDKDASKVISAGEAVLLSLSLSLDGLAVGIGVSVSDILKSAVLLFSLLLCGLFLPLGETLGRRFAQKLPDGFARIGGIILILLALAKFFN